MSRWGRWLALVVLVVAGFYAWYGGVFTSRGYRQIEQEEAEATVRLARLRHEVDSMRALKDSLADDPAVQERVAREQWGMIREGELSFRIKVKDRDSLVGDSGRN